MPKIYDSADYQRRSGRPPVLKTEPARSAFQKDYARLLHASSFRRLQGKTQLFPGAESDFFRNRLTHSLEVAQIASGIVDSINFRNKKLKIDRDLVQFAALAHDLGHPPFGHNGEKALQELMHDHGGFEGNAQTLRILTCTEKKLIKFEKEFSSDYGLDLTYRSLASILKYDSMIPMKGGSAKSIAKGYYKTEEKIVDTIKSKVAPGHRGHFKTVECWIMDIADDIAYSTYDLEDSLHAGFVNPAVLLSGLFDKSNIYDEVSRKTNKTLHESGYKLLQHDELLHVASQLLDIKGAGPGTEPSHSDAVIDRATKMVRIVNLNQLFCKNSLARTFYTAERVGKLIHQVNVEVNDSYPALSRVKLDREGLLDVEIFKHLNYELVIRSPKLAIVQYRGRDIVKKIFEAILSSGGDLLSDKWKIEYQLAGKSGRRRVVCDFVAGMTDRYAVEYHDALFGEGKTMYAPL